MYLNTTVEINERQIHEFYFTNAKEMKSQLISISKSEINTIYLCQKY